MQLHDLNEELCGDGQEVAQTGTQIAIRDCANVDGADRVQSFAALISVTSDWIVNHVSDNVGLVLGVQTEDLIGNPLEPLITNKAFHAISARVQSLGSLVTVERISGIQVMPDGVLFDIAVHRSNSSIVIELVRSEPVGVDDLTSYVRPMIARLADCTSVDELCAAAVRQVKALTGMDRVVIYRFAADGSGRVIAEAKNPDMSAVLGLTYPASDFPDRTPNLFLCNQLRVTADVNDDGAALVPAVNPEGRQLDLSLSTTRAEPPFRLAYLRRQGIAASMSLSVLQHNRLWGMFSGQHNVPMVPSHGLQNAMELFGLLFSYALDQVQSKTEQTELSKLKALHDRLVTQLATETSIVGSFDIIVGAIQEAIPHDGAIGWSDGYFQSIGNAPSRQEFMQLLPFLNTTAASKVFATDCLIEKFPEAVDYQPRAAGLLVLPVSRTPRDFIVLFRREVTQSVTWAGEPGKDAAGLRPLPRDSFDPWPQTIDDHSLAWTDAQIRAAEALRITLMEVVLRMSGVAIREQTRAKEHQDLLVAELNHRVRNIFNLIQGIMSQSSNRQPDIKSFTNVIGGRIHALARAHDQITNANWRMASLRSLIETEASAYVEDGTKRLVIDEGDALLSSRAYSALALVVHELMTNSTKYGALTAEKGVVNITISKSGEGGLQLVWTERGGPKVAPPTSRKFGTTIIERSLASEIRGSVAVNYPEAGLEASLLIPAEHVQEFIVQQDSVDAPLGTNAKEAFEAPRHVLIVEDNLIIGLDAETLLQNMGASDTVIASSVHDAVTHLKSGKFDFVLLDINLGAENGFPVAKVAVAQGVPVVFASGYGEMAGISPEFAHLPVLSKPYDAAELRRAMMASQLATDQNCLDKTDTSSRP